jgi:hypothetical protein
LDATVKGGSILTPLFLVANYAGIPFFIIPISVNPVKPEAASEALDLTE